MATIVGDRTGRSARAWRREAGALVALSLPIILTNLGQVAIQTTDVVMIGRLGPQALAASVLGVNVNFVLLLFSIGVVVATGPLIAQDIGRKRYAVRGPRRTVRQGFWVALALGLPAWLVLWEIVPILGLLHQDEALIRAAEPYVHAAMWGFVPALWFVVLRNFIAAFERPRAGMVVMLLGVAFNVLGDYALIFGAFGLPALGLRGAGIATALTNLGLFLGLLGFVLLDRRFRRYQILGRFWRPDWVRFGEIFRLGLPIGLTLVMEVGLFASAGFLIGLIGTASSRRIRSRCNARASLSWCRSASVRRPRSGSGSRPVAAIRPAWRAPA